MEDLNESICKVFQELTGRSLQTLADLAQSPLLGSLLHAIDPAEFAARDGSLDNWATVKSRLEAFLAQKGLSGQSLDFELEELSKGDSGALISALLQILAIFGAFNPAAWAGLLGALDLFTQANLARFLESMIAEIEQELARSGGQARAAAGDLSETIKHLLQKLERQEAAFEAQERQLAVARDELEKERSEKQRLARLVWEKDRELIELQQIKTEALGLLESGFPGTGDGRPGEDLAKKVERLTAEVEALGEKLLEARALALGKEAELHRLQHVQPCLEAKQTEVGELSEQLAHYKSLTDSLKKEQEIFVSKLKCFEYADRNIAKLNELLREERQAAAGLRARLAESEQTVEALQRRLDSSEDRLVIMRQGRLLLAGPRPEEATAPALYTRELEDENSRLRKQVKSFHRLQNELEMKQFADELRDKESEIMQSRIKSLLIENEYLSVQRTVDGEAELEREIYSKSTATIEPADCAAHELFDGKENDESLLLQHIRTGDFSWEDRELPTRLPSVTRPGDDLDLIYSSVMAYVHHEMVRQKTAAASRPQRTRDILKPFSLNVLLSSFKE